MKHHFVSNRRNVRFVSAQGPEGRASLREYRGEDWQRMWHEMKQPKERLMGQKGGVAGHERFIILLQPHDHCRIA
jgi:hypothetical protein